jgi:hypothetical protein
MAGQRSRSWCAQGRVLALAHEFTLSRQSRGEAALAVQLACPSPELPRQRHDQGGGGQACGPCCWQQGRVVNVRHWKRGLQKKQAARCSPLHWRCVKGRLCSRRNLTEVAGLRCCCRN